MFCLYTFPAHNLNFHWRWRRWNQIQAIFLNIFYFNHPIRILKLNKWTQYVQLFGGDEETARMWGNQIATQSTIFRFWSHTLQTYSVEVLLQLNCHSISAKNLKVWESIIKFTKQFSSLAWVCNTLQSDIYMPLVHQALQQQKTLLQLGFYRILCCSKEKYILDGELYKMKQRNREQSLVWI